MARAVKATDSRDRGDFGRSTSAARPGVKSCGRTLDAIEFFSRTTSPVRTSEVSRALGLPNSSVDEILRTLAARGYLVFDSRTRRYQPSYKIVGMSHAIDRNHFGGGRISAMMQALRDETGATVCMTVQNDCWIETVEQIEGDEPWMGDHGDYRRTLIYRDGTNWMPATNFAAILLARQSDVEIVELASRSQEVGCAPPGIAALGDLIRQIHHVRALGYALCRRRDTVQVDSIACPVPSPRTGAPVAVGILGPGLFTGGEESTRRLARSVQRVISSFHM